MNSTNIMIRRALLEANMKMYEAAALLNIRKDSFSRKLRKELSESDQLKIVALIKENAGAAYDKSAEG